MMEIDQMNREQNFNKEAFGARFCVLCAPRNSAACLKKVW